MIPIDTDWIFIICFWFYIQQMTIFSSQLGCALIIFPVFYSSLLFILYSSILPLLIFYCCLSIPSCWYDDFYYVTIHHLPPSLNLYHFWRFYFLHSLDLPILCLPSVSDRNISCKMPFHIWSTHTEFPYPIL